MTNGMYGLVIECIGSGNCDLFTAKLINWHSLHHHFFCQKMSAQVMNI